MLLGIQDKLADFEIIGVSFTFSVGVSSEEFGLYLVGDDVTPCNWGVLFASVSLEFDEESVGANAILCTDCKDVNRLGVSKSTRFEFT